MYNVGLMTWYRYYNYGTSLQVVALNSLIKELGYECKLINYRPKGNNIEKRKITDIVEKLKNKINYRSAYTNLVRDGLFIDFLSRNLDETQSCNSFVELQALNDQFDSFICGSDQIWSPLCFDSHYYLDFAPKDKIISYAPSFGASEIKIDSIKNEISGLVKRFKHLSVREEKGREIVKEIAGVDATVVLDPSLLHDKNYWEKLENKDIIGDIGKKYVVCYFLGESDVALKQIEKYCQRNNLKICNIPVFNETRINNYNHNSEIGPAEFLALIHNAEMIFTDSFHGTTFSIIYNKPFYVYKRFKDGSKRDQNSRIYNILSKLNLEERLIDNCCNIEEKEIDYKKVVAKVEVLKKESINYLKMALNDVCCRKDNNLKNVDRITNYCSGCGACSVACPKNAIEMIRGENGFYEYHIDKEKCINCNKCLKVCPMIELDSKRLEKALTLHSYKSNNDDALEKSSSGAFSYDIARRMISMGYVICGCTYNKALHRAEHILLQNADELERIQGSKYIQSVETEALSSLYAINKNTKLLYFGTPCQIAGAKKLLKNNSKFEEIIYVDMICHGIPTYFLFEKYLTELCKKYKMRYSNLEVNFRKKNRSWQERFIEITDENKIYENNELKDYFYKIFKSIDCLNGSCYECPYRENSSADIRIGDYWGDRYKNDRTGVSMVIAITEKGERLINDLKADNCAQIEKHDLSEYWSVQYPYNPKKPIYYDDFIYDLKNPKKSLKSIINEYMFYDEFIQKVRSVKRIFKRGK